MTRTSIQRLLWIALALLVFSQLARAQNLPPVPRRRWPFGTAFPATATTPNPAAARANAAPAMAALGNPVSTSAGAASLVSVHKISEDVCKVRG